MYFSWLGEKSCHLKWPGKTTRFFEFNFSAVSRSKCNIAEIFMKFERLKYEFFERASEI